MADLITKVKDDITQNNLLSKADIILVAFSGGPDSTALLLALHKLSKKFKFRLKACYINHNIRPQAVKKEIEFCRELCDKLKVPFILVDADIPRYARESKLSLEEAGRAFRLEALPKIARDENCNKIALGHHLDDAVETVLFRLFRGTGPGGLNPVKPLSGIFIRPLYNFTKSEIEGWLKKKKIKYMIDRTNLQSDYSRNYIRNKIIPVIEKHFGPMYRRSIETFIKIIAGEDEFLRCIAEKEIKKLSTVTPGGKIVVDLKKIGSYDVALRRRIIKTVLERLADRPGRGSFDEIERINDIIEGKLKTTNLGQGLRAIRDKDSLYFSAGNIKLSRRKIDIGSKINLSEINSALKTTVISSPSDDYKGRKNRLKVSIDLEKINQPLSIRGIRPGDRFVPLGMKGTKKAGDFLTDRKIPRYIRDEIPVIEDAEGIIWLAGHEISERVKIDKETRKVLQIELIRKKRKAQNS